MKKLFFLTSLILFLGSCQHSSSEDTSEDSARLPNIVYILADDLGYGDVSANNPTSKIQTTHIDALAKAGMRFTDAHSPSSVCTPTRYGILTGRYCWRSKLPKGVLRGYGRALIDKDRTTVASLLKKKGYQTGVVGKWHLGLDWVIKDGAEDYLNAEGTRTSEFGIVTEMDPELIDFTRKPTDGPLQHGFDYSYILPASLDMAPYCFLENDSLVAIPSEYTPGNDLNTGYTEAFWRAGRIAPGFEMDQVLPTFKDKAVSFIKRQTQEQPFFLYLPLAAPHTPWVPTADYRDSAAAGTYGDFVKMVDDQVGAVMKALADQGFEENTLLIFTSDNGPFWTPALIDTYDHRSAAKLKGMKADAWDGGHRIPYVARWPTQIQAGTTSDATTTLTHLMATLADITGVTLGVNEGPDSYSILPVLLGKTDTVPEQTAVIHHSSRNFFAIRQGDWKLIEQRGSGGFSQPTLITPEEGEPKGQLYNMQDDISETNNLYDQHPAIVKALQELLDSIREEEK